VRNSASPLVIAPWLSKIPYDVKKDFGSSRSCCACRSLAVFLHAVSGLAELIAMQRNPSRVIFGSAGSITHLAEELLRQSRSTWYTFPTRAPRRR
jgi:hypothetical protein